MNCVTTAEMIRNVSQCVDYLVNWNLVSSHFLQVINGGNVQWEGYFCKFEIISGF